MAKRAKKDEAVLVHLLDKTIGMEDNVTALMCGSLIADLDSKTNQFVDPIRADMPTICDKADLEGRMCPECKRGVTFYAKGVHKGMLEARAELMLRLAGAAAGVREDVVTH